MQNVCVRLGIGMICDHASIETEVIRNGSLVLCSHHCRADGNEGWTSFHVPAYCCLHITITLSEAQQQASALNLTFNGTLVFGEQMSST